MTSMAHPDVLVVGAGFVGAVAARLLAADGHAVTAVRRTQQERGAEGLAWLAVDLTTPAGIEALPHRADAVVFALPPVGGRDVAAYRRAHIDIPREVVARLASPPGRVVLTTSTAVYGVDDGSPVDEQTATEPTRDTAAVLVDAEHALRDLGPSTVALRLAGIYGPGRTRLVDQVRAGEASCAPGQWTNRIHRDDAASAIVHVLGLDEPAPTYNVVDDEPVERCEVLRWLAARVGAPDPVVLETPDAPGGRGGSKRVSNNLLRATGWRPRLSTFRDGYAEMLPG